MSNNHATFDLHLHSIWSYDANAPLEYYFQRAQDLGLRAFAITDHHNFDAFSEIQEVAKKFPGVGYIAGAEMTVKTRFDVFDIVCLGLPPTPPPKLQAVFDKYHQLQRDWGNALSALLQSRGFNYTAEDRLKLLQLYRPERAIKLQGITHVRNEIQFKYLLEKGYVKDIQDYGQTGWKALSEDGTFENSMFLDGLEVVQAVHDAGGIALIAHPSGYFHGMDEKLMDAITQELQLDGIECAHTCVPEEHTRFYRQYCLKHKLLSSAGTDCHEDPATSNFNLSPQGAEVGKHLGEPAWLDEILERVKLWNV